MFLLIVGMCEVRLDFSIDDNVGEGSYGCVILISMFISISMLGEGGSVCSMFISGLLLIFCFENVVKCDFKVLVEFCLYFFAFVVVVVFWLSVGFGWKVVFFWVFEFLLWWFD